MSEIIHEVHLPEPVLTKFDREKRAFYRLLPDLLQTHRNQYVAIHYEEVVDLGPNRTELADRVLKCLAASAKGGIYMALVSVGDLYLDHQDSRLPMQHRVCSRPSRGAMAATSSTISESFSIVPISD